MVASSFVFRGRFKIRKARNGAQYKHDERWTRKATAKMKPNNEQRINNRRLSSELLPGISELNKYSFFTFKKYPHKNRLLYGRGLLIE